MNRDPDERPPSDSGSEPDSEPDSDIADDFERMVAGWRRESPVPAWPDDEIPVELPSPAHPPQTYPTETHPVVGEPDGGEPGGSEAGGPGGAGPSEPGGSGSGGPNEPGGAAGEGHFVPPEPPPLPRLGPPALVGLALLGLGLVLVISPNWVGVPAPYGLPLGLLTLAAGLGWLVLRLWPDPPPCGDGDGEDDGAVL
ncbi:MAG: hypothetical protein ACRDRH_00410 [Pseudonocardia sp.]